MGKRLLVVDSDRRFIQDQKSQLESAFDVDFLYATEGALTRLEGGQYGALLLCVETSENKGYALCSAIRRTPQLADLKIALISGKASEEEYARHQATKGKADVYLHKPINANILVPALASLVPMREDDPDNPLGDLAGADLGDEWLESLKSELETDLLAPTGPAAPVPARPAAPAQAHPAEIELLEWRVKDLEAKLALQAGELESRNRELGNLELANASVTRNLDEIQQRLAGEDDLAQRLQDREAEAAAFAEQLREREADAAALAGELRERDAQAERLQGELDEFKAWVGQLQAELRGRQAEAERIEGELPGQTAEAERLQDELRARTADLDRLQMEFQEVEKKTGLLQDELLDRAAEAGRLQEELAGRDAEAERLKGELAERAGAEQALRDLLAQRDAQAERLHGDLQEAWDARQELADSLSAAQLQLTEKIQQNADYLDSHALLQAQVEEAWEAGNRVPELETALLGAQEALRGFETRALAAEQNCADLREELERARADAAVQGVLAQELEAAQGLLNERDQELASARDQVSFQELALHKLAEERSSLQAERDHQEDTLTEQAGELLVLQERAGMLESSFKEASEQRDQGLAAQERLQAAVAELEKRLAETGEANERQQRELLTGIEEREAHLARLNTTVDAQKERIAQLEEERDTLSTQARSRGDRLEAITTVLSEMEGKARQALEMAKAVTH